MATGSNTRNAGRGSSGLLPLSALLLAAAAAVAAQFAALAPEPYMDEPFHVPQTQRYCAGRWREWDPKITTFPGLYLFGAALGRLVHAVQRLVVPLLSGGAPPAPSPALCGTAALRSVSLLFAAACLPLFYHAAARLDASRSRQQLLLMTAACFLFPLHFFYSFLYYTDVPSLFFTLAAYLAGQYRRYHTAAALGALAVLMRQTNAVWVAFILASAAVDRCLPSGGKAGRSGKQQGASGDSSAGSSTLLQEGSQFLQRAWQLKWQLLRELWPLAAVVAAFAAFVVLNGGIVVGDKSHHAPVRHLMQPLYFIFYCTAWLGPVFWSPAALAAAARQLASQLRRQLGRTAVLAAGAAFAAVAAVRWSTLVHPFLLADNRHHTFYLWRRVLNTTPWARYALIPAYLYSGWALQQRLSSAGRRPLWVLLLAGATCAVLVPAQLVEFRYFTIPFYLCLLHMRTPSPRSLAAVVALFAAANAATLYLFLYRPFAWPDGSTARFTW